MSVKMNWSNLKRTSFSLRRGNFSFEIISRLNIFLLRHFMYVPNGIFLYKGNSFTLYRLHYNNEWFFRVSNQLKNLFQFSIIPAIALPYFLESRKSPTLIRNDCRISIVNRIATLNLIAV